MKYLIFFIALIVGVPVLSFIYSYNERLKSLVHLLFFICLTNDLSTRLSINIVSYEWYRGSSRGLEVTALDLIVLAILLSQVASKKILDFRLWINVESLIVVLFLFSGLISTVFAQVPLYALFGYWKFFRGFLIYLVFRTAFNRESMSQFISFFAVMILYQFTFVFWQKYFLGIYRVTGTLPHMNSLAMLINIYTLPCFSMALAGYAQLFNMMCVLFGVFIVVSTASRGALVCLILGFCIVFLISMVRGFSLKTWGFIALFILAFLLGAYKSSDTLINRFNNAPKESGETRVGFNECAKQMGEGFVFGVGINNFSHMMGNSSYGDLGPDLHNGEKDDGVAHHIYWLTFAETGYFGLFSLICLILLSLFKPIQVFYYSTNPLERAFAAGLFASLFTLHFQGFLEWILRQTNVWFLFCAILGLLSSLVSEIKLENKALLKSKV